MPISISRSRQTPGLPGCARSAGMLHPSVRRRPSRRADPRRQQRREPFEVEHPSDQERLLSDPQPPTSPEPSQPVPVFPFTERVLDLLPDSCPLSRNPPNAPVQVCGRTPDALAYRLPTRPPSPATGCYAVSQDWLTPTSRQPEPCTWAPQLARGQELVPQ